MGAVVDTSVLIDLECDPSTASRLPEGHYYVSLVSLAELQVGVEYGVGAQRVRREAFWELVCREFEVVTPSLAIAKRVGHITHALQIAGKLIGSHDLWIAATALELGEPVLTADVQDFARVPGLAVVPWVASRGTAQRP
ncbi:MAG TPA: PIN domain-containing protein [Polyangiales bacterium]